VRTYGEFDDGVKISHDLIDHHFAYVLDVEFVGFQNDFTYSAPL
jgi:hypothetical protein